MSMWRKPSFPEYDARIPGIVDPEMDETEIVQLEGFDAYRAHHASFSPSRSPAEILEWWRDQLHRRNENLRRAFVDRLDLETALMRRLPHHGPLVVSGDLDMKKPAIVALMRTDRRRITVVAGDVGTGKTTAAAVWMLRYASLRKTMPGFITAPALSKMSRYDEARAEIVDQKALVVDDLGSEYSDKGGMFKADFDEILDGFYASHRDLVITTNLDQRQFEDLYGPRVVDRIAEAGTWITVRGPSLRGHS